MSEESKMAMIRPLRARIKLQRKAHPFCAKDFLRKQHVSAETVPIESCAPSFFSDFIAGSGLIEPGVPTDWLSVDLYEVTEHFKPTDFFEAFGDPTSLTLDLSVLHTLMILGGEGAPFMLKDGSKHSFFITSMNNRVRHVSVRWGGVGWIFHATEDPYQASCVGKDRLFLPSPQPKFCMAA